MASITDGARVRVSEESGSINVRAPDSRVNAFEDESTIRLVQKDISSGIPYEGDYSVPPMLYVDRQLPTSGKTMVSDFILERIPYERTGNDSGGYTAIIAN